MLFGPQEIKDFLPHRSPFIFIDDVESITHPEHNLITLKNIAGVTVTGHYHTDPEHPIFKGHFPGNPILPGVIQVEMMAQICGFSVATLENIDFTGSPEMALLGISNAKFRKPITPGMRLTIQSKCIKPRGTIMTFDCKILHEKDLMSQCSVTAHMPLLKTIKTQHFVESAEKESHL